MFIQNKKQDAPFVQSSGDEKEWEIVFKGDFIAIEKHKSKGFERAVRAPGVRLILQNESGEILMTEEFRQEHGKHDRRLPGGKVFNNLEDYLSVRKDPDALHLAVMQAAKVEAKEEAGVEEIENLSMVLKSTAGATIEWDLYYLSGTVKKIGDQELDGDENLHGIKVSFHAREEVLRMLKAGEISEDRTVAALYRYLENEK